MLSAPLLALGMFSLGVGACEFQQEGHHEAAHQVEAQEGPKPALGLMTSLPLYWSLDADIGTLASGEAEIPWQRAVLEQRFELAPLDTLSPIAGLDPEAPAMDPLSGLNRLAVIQPRVLTPADNVALDQWVREGGQLLLVLDPALAGHFDLPLGHPKSPIETALIPPVVARWGLDITYDETQAPIREIAVDQTALPVALAGTIREIAGSDAKCRIVGEGVVARCDLGKGALVLIADAEVFLGGHTHESHSEYSAEDEIRSSALQALVRMAFD